MDIYNSNAKLRVTDGRFINIPYMQEKASLGNYIIVRYIVFGNKVDVIYGHLKKKSIKVKVGDKVKPGDYIAKSGKTGTTTSPCLHFCVKINGVKSNPFHEDRYMWAGEQSVFSKYCSGRYYNYRIQTRYSGAGSFKKRSKTDQVGKGVKKILVKQVDDFVDLRSQKKTKKVRVKIID